MLKFNRLLALLFAILIPLIGIRGDTFKNEKLHYVISYKWGMIHKDAGEATLTLRNSGKNYEVVLAAKTKPWADKVFMVRDTLKASILSNPFRPLRYEKIAHEGDKYSCDVITYNYSGSNILATARRKKLKDGKISVSQKNFSSQQEAFDMLSIFYFLRTVDYANIKKGHSIKKIVFSGSKSETITIRNIGEETIKLRNKTTAKAWHIRFNFTSNGGKKSSDDMDTWISVNYPHIPLQLEGNLAVGKVKCYYTD